MKRGSVLGVVLAGLLSAACSSDEGGAGGGSSSTSGTGTGGGGAAPATWGASACGTCVHEACAGAFQACLSDPECPAYVDCLDACPVGPDGNVDPTCQAGCPRGTGTESLRAAAAIDACRDPGAGAECTACGIPARSCLPDIPELNQTCTEPSIETNPCFVCQDENCCETIAACDANPDCVAYKQCTRDNADADDPYNLCAELHPGGVQDAAAGITCAIYHCAVDTPSCDAAERDPCLECLYCDCALEWSALERTADGFLLSWCIAACPVGDTACDQACLDAHPDSQERYLALAECVFAACGDAC